MSERGSFVTQYIYCKTCFEAAKNVLLEKNKFLCSTVISGWPAASDTLPIIAGKIGGSYAGEELFIFETDYGPRLAEVLCHPLRVAVIAEQGERMFTVMPQQIPNEFGHLLTPKALWSMYVEDGETPNV